PENGAELAGVLHAAVRRRGARVPVTAAHATGAGARTRLLVVLVAVLAGRAVQPARGAGVVDPADALFVAASVGTGGVVADVRAAGTEQGRRGDQPAGRQTGE